MNQPADSRSINTFHQIIFFSVLCSKKSNFIHPVLAEANIFQSIEESPMCEEQNQKRYGYFQRETE